MGWIYRGIQIDCDEPGLLAATLVSFNDLIGQRLADAQQVSPANLVLEA